MLAKAPDKPARQCCELLVMTEDIMNMVETSLTGPSTILDHYKRKRNISSTNYIFILISG
jgi:hypothetical protein